jgi:hypothetical protein
MLEMKPNKGIRTREKERTDIAFFPKSCIYHNFNLDSLSPPKRNTWSFVLDIGGIPGGTKRL